MAEVAKYLIFFTTNNLIVSVKNIIFFPKFSHVKLLLTWGIIREQNIFHMTQPCLLGRICNRIVGRITRKGGYIANSINLKMSPFKIISNLHCHWL
jgi:hypothetical protein